MDNTVVIYLFFYGTSILFSLVIIPIYIPTNSVGGFPILLTLSSIYCLWTFFFFFFGGLFVNGHSDCMRCYFIVVLICI